MTIIGDALRPAFIPTYEHESLREEKRVWVKLQKLIVVSVLGIICLAILVSTCISIKIAFPGHDGKQPFCSDRRLLPLITNAAIEVEYSDMLPGSFSSTNTMIVSSSETNKMIVASYWESVFIPAAFCFSASIMYHLAGIISPPATYGCVMVAADYSRASRRVGVRCLSIFNIVFAVTFGLLAIFLGPNLLTSGGSCSVPLFWCYEIVTWGLVILHVAIAFLFRRRAAVIRVENNFSGLDLGVMEVNSGISPYVPRLEGFESMGSSYLPSDNED